VQSDRLTSPSHVDSIWAAVRDTGGLRRSAAPPRRLAALRGERRRRRWKEDTTLDAFHGGHLAPRHDAGTPSADPGRRLAVAPGVTLYPAEPTGRSPPRAPHLPVSRGATALGVLRGEQRTRADRMEVGDRRSGSACARADRSGSASSSQQPRAPRPPLPDALGRAGRPRGRGADIGRNTPAGAPADVPASWRRSSTTHRGSSARPAFTV
jgi:hypothetical protein